MEIISRSYKYCIFCPIIPNYNLVIGMLYSKTMSLSNRNLRVTGGTLKQQPLHENLATWVWYFWRLKAYLLSLRKNLDQEAIFKQIPGTQSQWHISKQSNLIWFEVLQ